MAQTDSLKPLEYDPKPFVYSVFDIETNAPFNDKVWSVGYKDAKGYHKFSVERDNESVAYAGEEIGGPIDQFMRFLFDHEPITIYSHNGGNFDLQFVARWLVEHAIAFNLTCEIIPLSSSIMMLDVRRGRERWKFLDSGRIFTNGSTALSLDTVATTFKLPNKLVPEGVDKTVWYSTLHRKPERWSYLRTDVEILYAALEIFVVQLRGLGGDISVSGASTAMRTYRLAYQSLEIVVNRHFDNCDKVEGPGQEECVGCAHNVFRAAYYGGNVHPFYVKPFVSEKPVFYGDVNSMYPFAMLKPMPIGVFDEDNTRTKPKWENEVGYIEATVTIPDDTYLPPLPFRWKGKLIFPSGTFRGTWEATELAQIERVGGEVQDVHRALWSEAREIFGSYVRAMYQLRDKSRADYDPGKAAIAKILLNALYGKFGSNYAREKIWIHPTVDEIAEHSLKDMCDQFKTLFVEEVFVYPEYVIPQIAARVTALARCQLWGLMYEALEKGAKLYYCDTDSIVSTHEFKWSNELGGLKLEKVAHSGHFVAPKLYRFGDNESDEYRKAKGFGRGFGGKTTHQDWQGLVDGDEFETSRMAKLKSWARGGNGPGVRKVVKSRRSEYDKRVILSDGNTRAWIVREGALV